MIDGIPNRPLYFFQKDIIVWNALKNGIMMGKASFPTGDLATIRSFSVFLSIFSEMKPWNIYALYIW